MTSGVDFKLCNRNHFHSILKSKTSYIRYISLGYKIFKKNKKHNVTLTHRNKSKAIIQLCYIVVVYVTKKKGKKLILKIFGKHVSCLFALTELGSHTWVLIIIVKQSAATISDCLERNKLVLVLLWTYSPTIVSIIQWLVATSFVPIF